MRIIYFSLALTIAALVSQQLPQQKDPVDPPTPPPVSWPMQTSLTPTEHAGRALTGRVTIDTEKKDLSITWGFNSLGGDRVWAMQEFELTFWPTAAQELNGALIVAGKRSTDGYTIIERWSLDYPGVPDDAAGGYSMEVTSIEPIYAGDLPPKRVVRLMTRLYGAESGKGDILLQFGESNSLFRLDVDSGVFELVYSVSQLPDLAEPGWDFIWAGEHSEHGYIYVFMGSVDGDAPDPLVLLDSDKDAAVDTWARVNQSLWDSMLGEPVSWTRVFPD